MVDLLNATTVRWRNPRNELVAQTVGIDYDATADPLLLTEFAVYRIKPLYRNPQRDHYLEVAPFWDPQLGPRDGWRPECAFCARPADVIERAYGDERMMCMAHLYGREQLEPFELVRFQPQDCDQPECNVHHRVGV